MDRLIHSQEGGENLTAVACNLVFWRDWNRQHSNTHPLRFRFSEGNRVVPIDDLREDITLSASSTVFRTDVINRHQLEFSSLVKPNFEDAHFVVRYLMRASGCSVGFASKAIYHYRKRLGEDSTLDRSWTSEEQFYDKLKYGHLALIEEALETFGAVPDFVQFTLLYDLIWYYRRVLNNPATVAHLSVENKVRFHELVGEILSRIEPEILADVELAGVGSLHRVGLLAKSRGAVPETQIVYVDRWDDAKREVRLRYFTAGEVSESFRVHGCDLVPSHVKYRVHDFAGEVFALERIVWLPLPIGEGQLTVELDCGPTLLSLLNERTESIAISEIREQLSSNERSSPSFLDFKLRRLCELANSTSMRKNYSSVAFELAVLGRPTVYFQFDRDEVFGGGHLYEKGYFDYEDDGFGPVCLTKSDTLDVVEDIVRRGGNAPALYKQRMKAFFAYDDELNCERTYQAIARLGEPGAEVSIELLLDYARSAMRFEQWEAAATRWSQLLKRELSEEVRKEALHEHARSLDGYAEEERAQAAARATAGLQEKIEAART